MIRRLFAAIFILCSVSSYGADKSICGVSDERDFSFDKKIGKTVKKIGSKSGCTATLINRDCLISAGHCINHFKFVEFDIHERLQSRRAANMFEVIEDSIVAVNDKTYDYAVFKVKKNRVTGNYPGIERGYYPLSFKKVGAQELLRITGYGKDIDQPERSFTQQTTTGDIVNHYRHYLNHRVDTSNGNSGSSIINERTGEVVGIHTNGGCSRRTGSRNWGNGFYKNPALQKAILECLKK